MAAVATHTLGSVTTDPTRARRVEALPCIRVTMPEVWPCLGVAMPEVVGSPRAGGRVFHGTVMPGAKANKRPTGTGAI